MLTRLDHIIKNALENLVATQTPDWEVFYELWRAEDVPETEDVSPDSDFAEALANLDYTMAPPAWDLFETRLDALNLELEDSAFDAEIGQQLERLAERDWPDNSWDLMSQRLDELNTQMDAEFDETMGQALHNLPEPTWKEEHWQMLSSRLDRLNDRPRLIMMKVVEMAAIILLLVQLTNLYTGIQQNKISGENLTTYLEEKLNKVDQTGTKVEQSVPLAPELFDTDSPSDRSLQDKGQVTGEGSAHNPAGLSAEFELADMAAKNRESSTKPSYNRDPFPQREQNISPVISSLETTLNSDLEISVSGEQLQELKDRETYSDMARTYGQTAAPHLDHDPQLIAYSYAPSDPHTSSPRLGIRDISLLSVNATDSILNSIPTLQVIRPRIHSSIEVGMLADATNVEIKDFLSLAGSYDVPTLNAGGYFRYKIMYENMFGSLGGDYVSMRYDGLANDNQVTMVSLPLELGYNVVNLPSFRMYFSGGIAGRFVPVASYSTDNYNQASTYVRKSQKPSNGLLNNGPFEINSYLSGRLSMGLDININKRTSVSLRYSHDVWLKGGGIGYNLDKFRSSHLAIGSNFHF